MASDPPPYIPSVSVMFSTEQLFYFNHESHFEKGQAPHPILISGSSQQAVTRAFWIKTWTLTPLMSQLPFVFNRTIEETNLAV